MAIKKNILSQSNRFMEENSGRELLQQRLAEAKAKAETQTTPTKKASEAKARKDRRPQQINTHFTAQEKKMIEDLIFKMRLRGVGQKDAATEEIVHVAVCHYLASAGNLDELKPEQSEWWNKEFA